MTSSTPTNEGLSARLRRSASAFDRHRRPTAYEAEEDAATASELCEAAGALDAKDKLLAELRMQIRSCRCPVPIAGAADDTIGACVDGGLCGCFHRGAAEGGADFVTMSDHLHAANTLLSEAEKALREWAENPDGWNVDQVREAHATLAKIREHLKP